MTGVATIVFFLNKIPPNTCDIEVGKFTYHEVDIDKVVNGTLAESCSKDKGKNGSFRNVPKKINIFQSSQTTENIDCLNSG